ncbi:Endonuclease/exonuclease/phosphatase [Fomitopsis serialis]|uniref:Endonuclease/exonuclease/phosphatase n=1 Tax=Fomitopsis serialis TaxID=139415 RepID=UPI002007DEEC|nr:Endonuclease/exonuclease/phosphatase [Neoantrodia serialis]KAH9934711.1 Endonuclease/exonuclease/phosphatase [Neoantrodia serialis]
MRRPPPWASTRSLSTITAAAHRAHAAIRLITPHLLHRRLTTATPFRSATPASLSPTRHLPLTGSVKLYDCHRMPPKRAASGKAKRKLEEESADPETESSFGTESDAEGAGKAKGKGKAKAKPANGNDDGQKDGGEGSTSELAPNGQPTNRVMPVQVSFPPREEGRVRIATWNICGLAAAQKKGFKYYVEAEDPDILILTETKVNNEPVDPALTSRFPYRYWSIADKKTYSGTAILSKIQPISVSTTLPGHPDRSAVKGRLLTLEFENCWLVGTYVVNAGTGLKTLDAKKEWNKHFTAYIRSLDRQKPVIWAGDLNVAPTEKDLAHPKPNWNKTPGYTEAETSAFARILDPSLPPPGSDSESKSETDEGAGGFVDIWRKIHPDLRHYTYFGYRFQCRSKGIGWRLDMFVVSERLVDRVKMCEIRSEIYGASDHCPVTLELEGAL